MCSKGANLLSNILHILFSLPTWYWRSDDSTSSGMEPCEYLSQLRVVLAVLISLIQWFCPFFFWCSSIELMLYSFSRMQLGEHSAHQQLYSHGLVIVYVFWQQFVNCLDEILQKYPDDLDKAAELAVSSLQVWYFMIMVLHSIFTLEKKEDRCEMTMWYKCISQQCNKI